MIGFGLAPEASVDLLAGMPVLLAILLIVGVVVAIVSLAWRQQKLARANLQQLADRLELKVVRRTGLPGDLGQATGSIGDRLVRFWVFATGSGKSRQNWCAVSVQPRAGSTLNFEIRRQGFGTKIMSWFGAKEIEVGEPVFDAAWFIQTNEPEFLSAALVPEIRAKLMGLVGESGEDGYKLIDGEVRYAVRGYFSTVGIAERLEARLPVLADLADVAEVFAADQGRR